MIIRTIAFYNVENLFDIFSNSYTQDDDYTPNGRFAWTQSKYNDHLNKIAHVISKIGKKERKSAPDIVGLAEIENKTVLKDLIHTKALAPYNYGFIHYNSPDARGIDVALLYKKSVFTPTHHSTHPLELYNEKGERIFTRDQLAVSGLLDGEEIHFIVNHWPSRREGKKKTRKRREAAALLNKTLIEGFYQRNPNAKIISMGDFNDNAFDTSFKHILKTKGKRKDVFMQDLFNPMEAMYQRGMGSLVFEGRWDLFDQMYFSGTLLHAPKGTFYFVKSYVFNPSYLLYDNGLKPASPRRSMIQGRYTGGFSDHLPVYLLLKR